MPDTTATPVRRVTVLGLSSPCQMYLSLYQAIDAFGQTLINMQKQLGDKI